MQKHHLDDFLLSNLLFNLLDILLNSSPFTSENLDISFEPKFVLLHLLLVSHGHFRENEMDSKYENMLPYEWNKTSESGKNFESYHKSQHLEHCRHPLHLQLAFSACIAVRAVLLLLRAQS
mmetsp:Transcript_30872/g.42777  ORF Transcript_30872/g.42777 Transcript_30872/m.42777 type:complete len:121 (-) Transcript_30872:867-1229(-)